MKDTNSGDRNSGDRNSGDRNSGDRNSGNFNSGNFNSGNCNSGDCNSGLFNTNEPKLRMFNKDTDYTYSEFRDKFGWVDNELEFKLCDNQWVDEEDMTDEEKEEVDSWKQMGGYLREKTYTYKEMWANAWAKATDKLKQWFKNLPNFDSKIFKEITGIDIDEKSDCQRLRNSLFKVWETNTNQEEDFEIYYKRKMNAIIDKVKDNIN